MINDGTCTCTIIILLVQQTVFIHDIVQVCIGKDLLWLQYLGSSRYVCTDVPDHQIQALSVAGGVVVEFDITMVWPTSWGTLRLNNGRGLRKRWDYSVPRITCTIL